MLLHVVRVFVLYYVFFTRVSQVHTSRLVCTAVTTAIVSHTRHVAYPSHMIHYTLPLQVTYSFLSADFPTRRLPTTPQVGFIAQEIETLQPELVFTDSGGYKGVSYSHVSVLLTSAMQELQVKHDREVAELRKEVAELKKMVELLMGSKV